MAGVGLLWLLFVVMAYLTPVLLDDWYQLAWHRHHEFGIDSIWTYAHYNYFNFNPRLGDTMLLIVNGPPAIHLVVTPLVEMALLFMLYALAFGRWPHRTLRDLQLLLVIQVFVWLVVPYPGIMYFYRPFTTNYLFAFAIPLALFVPYRLELARAATETRPRHWLVLPMLALGWLAGMSNEHTGPTQMVAMAGFLYYAYRKRRLRPWMLAGALGLYVGYPMLFFAPGQRVRYGGLGAQTGPVQQIVERGFGGNAGIILDFLGEAQVAIEIVVAATLIALRAAWKAGTRPAGLTRGQVAAVAALICSAGAIVVTLFASPVVGERLFFAPGVLFVAALAILVNLAFEHAGARRIVVAVCLVIFAWHAERFLEIYSRAKADSDERLAILEATPKGTIAHVPPLREWSRTRWILGDDFTPASLREFVAHEVYGLAGIEFDRHMRWTEPTPPEHFVVTKTYDPPLDHDPVPNAYVPTYWEWAFVQLRKMLAFTDVGNVDGHRLVHYVVDAQDSPFVDPKGRPLRVLDWTPAGARFVEARSDEDETGMPYIHVWPSTVPKNWVDTYVVDCGRTTPVTAVASKRGPLIPVQFGCHGSATAIVCEPDVCWLAGRSMR